MDCEKQTMRRLQREEFIDDVRFTPQDDNLRAVSDSGMREWDLDARSQVKEWIATGCPVDETFQATQEGKVRTANKSTVFFVLSSIAQAIKESTSQKRVKTELNGLELAYLTKLIFPRLPLFVQEHLKKYVKVARIKHRTRRTH